MVVGQEADDSEWEDWNQSEGRPFTVPLEQNIMGHCRTFVHRLRTSFLFPGDLVPRERISTPAWCYCPLTGQKGKRLLLGDRSHKCNALGFIYRSTFLVLFAAKQNSLEIASRKCWRHACQASGAHKSSRKGVPPLQAHLCEWPS